MAFATHEDNGPIIMLNLLKFKDKVEETGESGLASYASYSQKVAPLLAKVGGKPLLHAKTDQVLIGSDEEDLWDQVLVVEYPSRAAFIQMVQSPEYQEALPERNQALERSKLIVNSKA